MSAIPRSTFYYRPMTRAKEKADADLRDRIEQITLEFPRYGYRRIIHQLKRDGFCVNHKRVLRVMRESSLLVAAKKGWRKTTDSNHPFPTCPDLTKELVLDSINQLWVADITCIRIEIGFVYLAVILDAFSRRVLGYHVSGRLSAEIALRALDMTIYHREPPPGVIHHSDRGVQYASAGYTERLLGAGFQVSMARKSNPYYNAMAESFIKTLKAEEVYHCEYQNLADVRERIPCFLETVYNKKRLHSSPGYRPPEEFENQLDFQGRKSHAAQPGYPNLTV